MELRFQKSQCNYLQRLNREVQNLEQTQEIKLTDGMPDIGRVLSAWGQVILRSKEWRSGGVSFSGGIMVWVLYSPEDGSEARCVESWIPFQMKWDINDEGREGDIRIQCIPRFVDARNVSARKIMVRAGVAALCETYVNWDADIFEPGEMPEDVQLLRRSYPMRMPREAGEKSFLLDEQLTLPASCPKPAKLICFYLQPEVTDQKLLANRVVFRGNGNLHILYKSEEGQLFGWDFEVPFSQYADLNGEYSGDAKADVAIGVTNLELDLDDEKNLRLKCGMLGQYLVDDRYMAQITEDAYSPSRPVSVQTQMLELPAMLESRREMMTAEQTIPQDANMVVDTTFLPDFPRQHRGENGIEMELPGQFQVLYYGEDGTLRSANTRWEGKYQMTADEDSRLDAFSAPVGRPQATVGDGTIDVRNDVQLRLDTIGGSGIPMVTGLELGEQREPDPGRPSVILRRAGESRLWDIAKDTGSTMEAIRQANGIEGEPEMNRILLIPVS